MSSGSAWNVETSFGAKLPSAGNCKRPSADAPAPDGATNASSGTKVTPPVVDRSMPNIDKSVGFDPYDTGVLQEKISHD